MSDFAAGAAPAQTDSPRFELRAGIAVIVAFFGLFLGWAAFAPLDAGAFAHGRVAVSGNRQAVQHREGGVVRSLRVAEGDHVAKGQVLVQLNDGELRAAERGLAGQVYALLAQRSRLIAERDRLGALPVPPEFADLSADDRAVADEALRLQRQQFAARGAGRSTQTGVLGQRVGQLQDQMDGYQRQIEANAEQQRLIGEELEGIRSLAARGYAPQTRVRALERTAAALEGEQGSLRAQVARTREQIGETRLQMAGVTTTLNEDVAEQLRQVEVQLNDLQPRLADLRSQIARAEIRSPATGQVVGLTVFTQGGVIAPGQTVMEVVPDDVSQVIVADVDPSYIDNLRVGLTSEIKFPGLHERNPPLLHGRVTLISPDAIADPQTGRTHYRVEIVAPPSELAKLGPAADQIRAGMPAEVVILTRKRTALAYLTEPLTRSLWRSGAEQ
ncbi:HlyD family type I secretion periplasmic adaptor subunit [Brevundimonas albigilva]|uniref:Membrane fusion protein (MFP) family protein n=2 Tax=Brevundimonas TaxID=41275 RepID=A0ABY4SPX2_9CAUL|nr:HlyD family type I secretion periplasmic adaptor subunit [Brevundimonas albigilva]UQV19314.1 HlyD family type I secretion periplasmic adaptor subunit [Brevundimonas albigilva]URI15766.1 HlyD family type I secretion periplasmic adaptor subunit [Brevundimonas albigilva]